MAEPLTSDGHHKTSLNFMSYNAKFGDFFSKVGYF